MPKVWFVTELLQKLGLTGVAILIMIFFALLKDEHGKHVISLENCHNYVPWPVFWLIAFAMPLGNAIKSPDSGIMATITNFVTPLFDNVNIYVFMILAMVLVGVLTQVSNNMVLGAIFIPVFTNICIQMGGNPYVLFLMLMYSVNCAYCTPAASFQGALVHGNENVSKKYAYLIGFTALVVTWVACLVMIPLGFLFW